MELDNRIQILASVASPMERTRIYKLCVVLLNTDFGLKFVGWDRNHDYQSPEGGMTNDLDVSLSHLMRGGGYANKWLALYYPIWFLKVFIFGLIKKQSNFYCLAFDTAFPIALASLFRRHNFIFDNADNFSKSYAWPFFIKKLLEKCEKFTASRAAVHLIPSKSRWENHQDVNCKIVPNIPTAKAIEEAQQIASSLPKRETSKKLTLYVNGRLIHSRGISILNTLLLQIPSQYVTQLEILLAGDLISPEAHTLANSVYVNYLGVLTNEKALAWYYRSDVVLTFYDPRIEINRLAEPNKWGDAIATNTPFIVNDEVITAQNYREKDACFSVPYDDMGKLRALLVDLIDDPTVLAKVKGELSKHFSFVTWDQQMLSLIHDWLKPV